jgi:hypothetical protein
MVDLSQSQSPHEVLGFFRSDLEKEIYPMINITAKPVWQWSTKKLPARSFQASAANTGTSALKQALMPRSLDVAFSLKYRR